MSTDTAPRSAFFYGTLMAPQVLNRVCHGDFQTSTTRRLTVRPAVLDQYRRHRVKFADYPAIVHTRDGDSSVSGSYVAGLTDGDVARLDIFEGSEYVRTKVRVRLMDGGIDADHVEVDAETYVWIASPGALEDREWDFGEFQREKMHLWVGDRGQGEYEGKRRDEPGH